MSVEVLPVPFGYVRFQLLGHHKFRLAEQWIPLSTHPAIASGRIRCTSEKQCTRIARQIKHDEHFASDLMMHFSTRNSISYRKTVVDVTFNHILLTPTFTTIESRDGNRNSVCMKFEDFTDLGYDLMDVVFESELNADEFLEEDQVQKGHARISGLLRPKVTSTAHLADGWNEVFWRVENERPDRKAATFTELFSNNRKWLQLLMSGSLTDGNSSFTFPTSYETQAFIAVMKDIRESEDVIKWNGEAFIVKPMAVHCINITALRSREAIGKVTVRISNSHADYSALTNLNAASAEAPRVQVTSSESAEDLAAANFTVLQQQMESLAMDAHRNWSSVVQKFNALSTTCSGIVNISVFNTVTSRFLSDFNTLAEKVSVLKNNVTEQVHNLLRRDTELELKITTALGADSTVAETTNKISMLRSDLQVVKEDLVSLKANDATLALQIQQLNILPIGTIVAFPTGHVLPSCWLKCDGQYFSSLSYPQLARIFSDQRLPNLAGKFLLGPDTSEYPLGSTGGEKQHSLTQAEMPKHIHGVECDGFFLTFNKKHPKIYYDINNADWESTNQTGNYIGWSHTTAAGGSQPHNNMPPYYSVLYYIRAC
ncbi:uncharacterized protein LOC129589845 [Paramacrobiotus metropolitanus]|uniref:uncharacterized protein LOC129589845 n=1 Tax=Paramacrobiotus metropolitanus TaxID=2943436 RepID=UPI0024456E75|nr:uncharacterized protein LOC129589845 [Paramacrobiotus metropolitanus]